MSKDNAQAQQVEPAKPVPRVGKGHSPDVQTEIGQAFEVASAIERAVRTETTESLEQFLTRAATVLFQRSDETSMRISPVTGFDDLGAVQVHTDGDGALRFEIFDSSPDQKRCAHECMKQFGFVPNSIRDSGTNDRDVDSLDATIVAGLACCILKKLFAIASKSQILCWFDHDDVRSSEPRLHSLDDLSDCVKALVSHEPNKVDFSINHKGRSEVLLMLRRSAGRICLQLHSLLDGLGKKPKAQMREILEASGFVIDPQYLEQPSYPRQDWFGPENVNLVASTVKSILEIGSARLESRGLHAYLCWPAFFA